jgi:hypothetical protein
MRSSPNGGMIVSNSEELTQVISSSTANGFTSVTVPLVPSQTNWLKGVASSFSKFRWIRLRVFYIPAVGTSISGRIAASLVYDGADLAPSSVSNIIAGFRATFGPVWAGQSGFDSSNPFTGHSDMVHLDLDCSRSAKRYYPYIGLAAYNALSSADKNIYNPATLLIGSDGIAGVSSTVGSFYLSYEVELLEPVAVGINA